MPKQLVLPGQKSAHIWLWSRWIEQSSAHLEEAVLTYIALYCLKKAKYFTNGNDKDPTFCTKYHRSIAHFEYSYIA